MKFLVKCLKIQQLINRSPRASGFAHSLFDCKRYCTKKCEYTLPKTATCLDNNDNATIVLLGTVHFSKKSIDDVSTVMEEVKPNGVLIELCRQRVHLLELDDKKFLEDAKNFDANKMRKAMKGHDTVTGVMHAVLLKSYAELSRELGVAPGGEFRKAYHEIRKHPGCKLFLGDRPIQITLARAFRSLTIFEMISLLSLMNKATPEPFNKESVEKYKDKVFVKDHFDELVRKFPAFRKIFEVFVDERDKCLAFSLQECVKSCQAKTTAEPVKVFAVVGMGHVEGISRYYGKMKREDILPLLTIPPPPMINRIVTTSIRFTFWFIVFSLLYRILFL